MRAMVLEKITRVEDEPLKLREVKVPDISENEILVKISVCGVCHTELDEIEGRVKPKLPVIPGHEIVGYVEKTGSRVKRFDTGDRVGIGWIYSACGECKFCKSGRENLCYNFRATGCDEDGGYAEYIKINENFAYPIPDTFSNSEAAPLMCAGAIGYRALRLTQMRDGDTIALYGFGASAHIVIQIVKHLYPDSQVFVFTKRRDDEPSKLARKMGADWVGITGDTPPEKFDRAIDTTPVGIPVAEALRNMERGGRLVINAIRKETKIPEMDYANHLWEEKEVKSVANITRKDIEDFLKIAAEIPIKPEVKEFKLEEANRALVMLKHGKYRGAGVLKIL